MTSLKNKAVSSVVWSAVDRFSAQAVQFVIAIVIARILLPSDFGLIAMLGIFLAIAQTFVDSGFTNALIQKKNRTDVDYSTAFIANIIISISVYIILYFSAPFIANFYQIPELELIVKVISLNIVISAFGIVQRARLTILLNFKLQAVISLSSAILSGIIAIVMAYQGFGVWALVMQSLTNNFLTIILLWVSSHWKPSFSFSKQSFATMFNFGYKLLMSGLLHTIYLNLYTLVIGKKFSSADAGYYNRAFTFSQLPSANITQVITRAIYPIQCSIQDDDEKLRYSFLSYLRMSCFVVFPIMIGLCALAKPLVIVLLTEKWFSMIPLLQLLCIAYMWYPIMAINSNILNVKGRSDYFLQAEILKKIMAIIILFASIPFGLKIMCAGLIFYSFVDIFIITRYSYRIVRIGIWRQLKELVPILLQATTMGVLMYFSLVLCNYAWAQLIIGMAIGLLFFIGSSIIFKIKEFYYVKEIIRYYICSIINVIISKK